MTTNDKIKLAASIILVAAGLAVFYALPSLSVYARAASVVLSLVAAAALLWFSNLGRNFGAYAKSSVVEVRRVVWPTRRETLQMTGVVIVFVIVLALFLSVVDWALFKLVNGILLGKG